MKSKYLRLAVFVVVFLTISTRAVADDAVERVFCNAKIFTAEPDHPYAEAVAIRNGKIVAVGSCAEVKKAAGKDAEFADLHGQSLLPGFIDSHSHSVQGGLSLISADVGDQILHGVNLVADIRGDQREATLDGMAMTVDESRKQRLPVKIGKFSILTSRFLYLSTTADSNDFAVPNSHRLGVGVVRLSGKDFSVTENTLYRVISHSAIVDRQKYNDEDSQPKIFRLHPAPLSSRSPQAATRAILCASSQERRRLLRNPEDWYHQPNQNRASEWIAAMPPKSRRKLHGEKLDCTARP